MSASAVGVVPRASAIECTDQDLVVLLDDGRRLAAPLTWFPRLLAATPVQRAQWRLIGGGEGIRWDRLDEDLSVRGLLRGDKAVR